MKKIYPYFFFVLSILYCWNQQYEVLKAETQQLMSQLISDTHLI